MEDSFFENDQLHLIQHAQSGKIIGDIVNVRTQADATSTPAMGSVVVHEVKKNGDDWYNRGALVFVISALSNGSGGSYNRFVNAIALFLFTRFELWQKGQIKDTTYPINIFQNVKYYTNSDFYSCIAQQLAINSSTSARNTLAASAQTLVIPLNILFSLFSKPFDRALIEDTLEIRSYLRSQQRYVIQTDHSTAPSFTITDTYLDLEYVKPKVSLINASRQIYNQNGSIGTPYFDIEHIVLERPLQASTTSATIVLPELNDKRVIDINVLLRANALSDTNDASDYTDTLIAPATFNLKSSGKYLSYGVQRDITKDYYDKVLLPRLKLPGWVNILSGTASANEFLISYANDHKVEDSEFKRYHGSRYFTEKDSQLYITFSSLAALTDAIIIIRCANRFCIHDGVITDL